jgi:hypothetical protein
MNFKLIWIAFAIIVLTQCTTRKNNLKAKDVVVDKCKLVPETGKCKAAKIRYYFDNKTGKCTEFTWGGCEGVVPFETLKECEACGCSKD